MSASEIIIVIVVVLVWLGLISLVLRGWRNRGRRQAELIGEMPVAPTELGEPQLGPDSGLYVGSTLAPSWQNRVAVGDVGDRHRRVRAQPFGGLLQPVAPDDREGCEPDVPIS